MPNRIVREGANASERVDALSAEAERFYRRLLNVVDDFGRFDGRITILISRAFPLIMDQISIAEAERWLQECASGPNPLVLIYYHSGKRYIEIEKFGQQIRAKSSKWPAPAKADIETRKESATHVHVSATHVISDAEHVHASACLCSPNPESESETKGKSETKTNTPLPPKGGSEVRVIPQADLLDEIWAEFRRAALEREVLPAGNEDWKGAWFAWKVLDTEQKLAALNDVRIRAPDSAEMKSLPVNYLKYKKWQRPMQSATSNSETQLTKRIKNL